MPQHAPRAGRHARRPRAGRWARTGRCQHAAVKPVAHGEPHVRRQLPSLALGAPAAARALSAAAAAPASPAAAAARRSSLVRGLAGGTLPCSDQPRAGV